MAENAENPLPLAVQKFRQFTDPDTNAAEAVFQALTEVFKQSEASTIMQVKEELEAAAAVLKQENGSTVAISSGCELFIGHVMSILNTNEKFDSCKRNLLDKLEKFKKMTIITRLEIANYTERFITDDSTILVHGYSRVVLAILRNAAIKNKRFRVIVTECRQDQAGVRMLKELGTIGVPTFFISDCAVAHYMAKEVDMVFVGAEMVVENGGIVNKIGTFQLSIIAHSFNKPFYVAAESYTFTRYYPLNQQDLPDMGTQPPLTVEGLPSSTKVLNSSSDYTPPQYIRLLFTDLGVLTPSAVSDELIRRQQLF